MLLFSVNFTVYFLVISKKLTQALKNEELRTFFVIVAAAVILVTVNITPHYEGSIPTALRYASFQVASVISTAGFATADYTEWPFFSQMILLLLSDLHLIFCFHTVNDYFGSICLAGFPGMFVGLAAFNPPPAPYICARFQLSYNIREEP